MKKCYLAIFGLLLLGACMNQVETASIQPQRRFRYANEETEISLLQPFTSVIVRCYSTKYEPAETCAQFFEEKGYVRFRNIPYKTANYDFLKANGYPTRRWRPGEITPRW